MALNSVCMSGVHGANRRHLWLSPVSACPNVGGRLSAPVSCISGITLAHGQGGIAICNATLYMDWTSSWATSSYRFVVLPSECGQSLNGVDCLLRTPDKLAVGTVHLVNRQSH